MRITIFYNESSTMRYLEFRMELTTNDHAKLLCGDYNKWILKSLKEWRKNLFGITFTASHLRYWTETYEKNDLLTFLVVVYS